MTPVEGLSQAWRWSVRKTLSRWVRPTIKPEDAAAAVKLREEGLNLVRQALGLLFQVRDGLANEVQPLFAQLHGRTWNSKPSA